jgi:BirA family biotin operon repressor/biotin-[acetyl-CoA-carboxylase] ligase
MDQKFLETRLADLPIQEIRYFGQIDSTNTFAADWAKEGAPDLSLVIADEQTAGRGRGSRKWYTPPQSALAFSLILHPSRTKDEVLAFENTARLNGLGALAVLGALQKRYGLPAQIKWPNDVLVHNCKLAGILPESHWSGDQLTTVVLGIGINVAPPSVPPENRLNFPATCVESVLGKPVDRIKLLYEILVELQYWRPKLNSPEFLQAWEANLAFRDQEVKVTSEQGDQLQGRIGGLKPDGSLWIKSPSAENITLHVGEIHPTGNDLQLGLVDSSQKSAKLKLF